MSAGAATFVLNTRAQLSMFIVNAVSIFRFCERERSRSASP